MKTTSDKNGFIKDLLTNNIKIAVFDLGLIGRRNDRKFVSYSVEFISPIKDMIVELMKSSLTIVIASDMFNHDAKTMQTIKDSIYNLFEWRDEKNLVSFINYNHTEIHNAGGIKTVSENYLEKSKYVYDERDFEYVVRMITEPPDKQYLKKFGIPNCLVNLRLVEMIHNVSSDKIIHFCDGGYTRHINMYSTAELKQHEGKFKYITYNINQRIIHNLTNNTKHNHKTYFNLPENCIVIDKTDNETQLDFANDLRQCCKANKFSIIICTDDGGYTINI